MRQREHVRQIVLGDEREKHIDARTSRRHQALVLQKLGQHDVAHPEPQRRQVHTAQGLEQVVVAPATADGAQRPPGVEQLEHDAGVVGQPPNDREIDLTNSPSPIAVQRRGSLAQRIRRLGRIGGLRQFQLPAGPDPGSWRSLQIR